MFFRRKPKKPSDDIIIYRPPDRGAIILAQSILRAAGIRCVVDNDYVQDLVGLGRMGYGYNFVTGGAKISVMREDALVAEALLSDVKQSIPSRFPLAVRILAIAILGTEVVLGILITIVRN